jgi:hypothetical protein
VCAPLLTTLHFTFHLIALLASQVVIEVAREGDPDQRQHFTFEAPEPEHIATAIEFFMLKCTRRRSP